jgi:hypothetical protein
MTQPMTTSVVSEGPEAKSSSRMGANVRYSDVSSDRRTRERWDSATECVRVFRRQTERLSQRLPLRSVESMRAGKVKSPHAVVHEYLAAARRAGLPRQFGAEFLAFTATLVEEMWATEKPPVQYVLTKEQDAENACNSAELRFLCDPTDTNRQALRDCLRAEIAAETAALAVLTHPTA